MPTKPQTPKTRRVAARLGFNASKALDRLMAAEPGLSVNNAIENALIAAARRL